MTKLPAESRKQSILHLLNEGPGLSISTIAKTFGVSNETIRRDLAALEKDGALKRVYGGAMPAGRDADLEERVRVEAHGKQAIGEIVAELIKPDQWIFMTAGSSSLAVARAMKDGPSVSVMTNMPQIGDVLEGGSRHKVYLTGGEYDSKDRRLSGFEVLEAVNQCSFDLAIIGIYGLDAEYGMVEQTRHHMILKKSLLTVSRSNICVGDHTKIGAIARYKSLAFDEIDTLVTNRSFDGPLRQSLQSAGTKVIFPTIETHVETPIQRGSSSEGSI